MSKCKGECFCNMGYVAREGWGNIAEANKQNSGSNNAWHILDEKLGMNLH